MARRRMTWGRNGRRIGVRQRDCGWLGSTVVTHRRSRGEPGGTVVDLCVRLAGGHGTVLGDGVGACADPIRADGGVFGCVAGCVCHCCCYCWRWSGGEERDAAVGSVCDGVVVVTTRLVVHRNGEGEENEQSEHGNERGVML
jgi:hypothetical protein